jgi:hypothetical protein
LWLAAGVNFQVRAAMTTAASSVPLGRFIADATEAC